MPDTGSAGYALIDCMDLGINETYCSCGQRLYPDCDISSVSIAQEFERHLQEAHGRQGASDEHVGGNRG